MNVLIYIALLAYGLLETCLAQDSVLIASTREDKRYDKAKEIQIDGFQVSHGKGLIQEGILVREPSSFQVLKPGIYITTVTIIFNAHLSGVINLTLCDVSDKEKDILTTSTFAEQGDSTLQLYGVVKFYFLDTITIKIKGIDNSGFTIRAKSSISLMRVAHATEIPSFMGSLAYDLLLDSDKDTLVAPISLGLSSHSFSEGEIFSSEAGSFAAALKGMYFVAANMIIKKEAKVGQYTVLCLLNSITKISETVYQPGRECTTYSVTIALSFYAQRGDILSIKVKSHYPIRSELLKETTLSATSLNSMFTNPTGFSLEAQNSNMVISQGWTSIAMDKLSSSVKGGLNGGDDFSVSQNRFSVRRSGIYLYGSIVKVSSLSRLSGLTFSLLINGIPINLRDGSFISSTINTASKEHSLSFSTMMKLEAGDFVTVNIHNPIYRAWYIEKGSRFTVCRVSSFSNVFSKGLLGIPKLSSGWTELSGWENELGPGRFDLSISYDKKQGRYLVLTSGIYYVHASIVLSEVDVTFLQVAIAVDGNPNRAEGLSTRKTNVIGSTTLRVSSVVKLTRSSFVSVYLYLEGIKSIDIGNMSRFSLYYFCHEDTSSGFHAITPNDLILDTPQKWIPINNFRSERERPWMFNTLSNDLFQREDVHIPQEGLYVVFATIIIGNADLLSSDSFFRVLISVDENLGEQVLQVRQSAEYTAGVQNSNNEVTLCVSGTVMLLKNSKLKVLLFSNKDNYFIVRKASGFSVLLIYEKMSSFMNGFLVPRTQGASIIKSNIAGWSTIGKGGGRYIKENGAILYGGSQLKVEKEGIYSVFFTTDLKRGSTDEIGIGILITYPDAVVKQPCSKSQISSSVTTLSCELLLYFPKNTEVLLITFIDEESKTDLIVESGYFSVVRLPQIGGFPHVLALLKEFEGVHGRSSSLRQWSSKSTKRSVINGNAIFDDKTGVFTAPVGGQYLFSVCLQFESPFLPTEKVLLSLKTKTTSFNATINRRKWKTFSFTSFVSTKRQQMVTIEVASSSPLGLGTKTRLSISLIPKRLYSSATRFQLSKNVQMASTKKKVLTGWIPNRGKKVTYQDHIFFNGDSVILIQLNLQGECEGNDITINMRDPNSKRNLLHFSKETQSGMFSLSLTSLFITKHAVTKNIEIQSFQGLTGYISSLSDLHVISLGHVKSVPSLIGKTSQLILYEGVRNHWTLVQGFYPEHVSDMYVIDSRVLIKISGIYLVHLNIILDCAERVVFDTSVYVVQNDTPLPELFASKEVTSASTLSITATVYLARGTMLQPAVKTEFSIQFAVQQESSFALALLENLEEGVSQQFGPVVLKDLAPDNYIALEFGKERLLVCNAVGDGPIQYYWYRDNVLLQFNSPELLLKGQYLEAGSYYCEAKADERKMVSPTTRVKIYDVDECQAGLHGCTKDNQTCVNTQGGYYCACANGFAFRGGDCLIMKGEPGYQKKYTKHYLPTAVRVLVPILCIVIFFIFALSIYTCYKHQKSRGTDLNVETAAFTSDSRENVEENNDRPLYDTELYEMGETIGNNDDGHMERERRNRSLSACDDSSRT